MSSLLEAALAAAERDWPVFPLIPGTKRPAVKDWESRATTDVERITRCWSHADYNIGIATGPANLVVIDLDIPKPGERVPAELAAQGIHDGIDIWVLLLDQADSPETYFTYTVTTPSGGEHFYYTTPPDILFRNTQAKLGWKIDTRAWGGYVVAAGSTVDGREYIADKSNGSLGILPSWLADQLVFKPPVPRIAPIVSKSERLPAYITAAIKGETKRVSTAIPGTHKSTLFIASVALGQLVAGGLLPTATAETELFNAALTMITDNCDCTEHEINRTITNGLRAGAQRPRHNSSVGGRS